MVDKQVGVFIFAGNVFRMIELTLALLTVILCFTLYLLWKLARDVRYIKAEVSFNGGSSMKDRLARMEEAQELSILKLKFQVEDSRMGIMECDANGEATAVNKSLSMMFGISPEKMLGRGWLAGVGPAQFVRENTWMNWTYAVNHDIPFEATLDVVNQITQQPVKLRMTSHPHRSRFTGEILQYYCTFDYVKL